MATDITVTTITYKDADRSWLLFEANGTVGPVARAAGVINYALFTANTHYPDGFIKSGTLLGRVTSGGKLGPYDDAASDGRQTCVGLLFNNEQVPASTAQVATVPYIDSFAVVSQAKLPANSGNDANGRADLPLVKFRA
ncbi:head decoration protein [Kineosporia succinea]|uniref:Bacteriophage lambda head decoration protein D n=1 Tax=Kineosporia succinea TaxID=84632 RepID=A0ABT9NXT3_9ACTN|nr:head decoration protein [Kineosporia succinea]MDP9825220.1 hypothetical protein [Kineosporia succinea]